MKNILLVSPDFDIESFWITEEQGAKAEVLNDVAPVGLATIAAMVPETYQVNIWDEVVHGRIDEPGRLQKEYDLVGLTGYNTHFLRSAEIAQFFRKRGALLVVGGPGVSGMPDRYRPYFDVLFIGEAERTWLKFLKDWEAGAHKPEYRQIEKIELTDSPLPRWDSIAQDLGKYAMGGVQTTRGCPFDCEFCDVIYLFGRKMRHKPISNVIEEVKNLERHGVANIIFCDDEFVGDPRYTKELLRTLIPVNNSFKQPITFTTQVSMNLSRDDELLQLMADANFGLIFVGIETPNKASLQETGKFHNLRENLVNDVRKILSYGIAIRAGLIVGFDHDTTDIFAAQDEFVHETCLPSTTLSLLKAIPGTRLWRRLQREGRILDITKIKGNSRSGSAFKTRSYTNIIPKMMTRIELMQGFRDLAKQIYSWDSFNRRIRGFVSNIKRLPNVAEPPLTRSEIESFMNLGRSGGDAQRAVEEIRAHVERVAPSLLRRVRMLSLQHAKHQQTFDAVLPQIDKLISLESSGALTFELDDRPVPIPEAFRDIIRQDDLFSDMHGRAYDMLIDKSRVPEALVEVFVDFLLRERDTFTAFEPQHIAFLNELIDRTCAQYNKTAKDELREAPALPMPNVRSIRLAEDVVRNVELELISKKKAS